jgi:peptide/nickel transport system permease protein
MNRKKFLERERILMKRFIKFILTSKLGTAGFTMFFLCVLISVFAPVIAPYPPQEQHYSTDKTLLKLMPPSKDHYLGTTLLGKDVFSQIIWGGRPALVIGIATALAVIFIGVSIGLISGYYGGWVDNLLMRITDIFMGVPFLPFIIVVLSLWGPSLTTIIFSMATIMWRSTARVIRSQVLTLKERPFVDAARVTGASDFKIMFFEIAPNILPIALVNVAFALAWAIITEASIGFLGFGDPEVLSWGTIIYSAFASEMSYKAWWWVLPPGVAIMIIVTSVYFIGRAYEEVVNPRLKKW